MSSKTLYRRFKDDEQLNISTLPLKGKRKPNGHQETRGKHSSTRSIHSRKDSYSQFDTEFGHLEGDTIVGKKHKSAIITLVERQSKIIITLKPDGRTAKAVGYRMSQFLAHCPHHLFKSITFDCGKEFSNWKSLSNDHDIDIFFADPGCPGQRGLNERSNGLLRHDGLAKQMDFNTVDEAFIQSVSDYRNHIPRRSLKYRTPIEVFEAQTGYHLSEIFTE